MINTDNHIREIFSRKLGNIESDVPDYLWENVSKNLQSAGSAPAPATAAKSVVSKLWIAAGVAGTIITSVVVFNVFDERGKAEVSATTITQPVSVSVENNAEVQTDEQQVAVGSEVVGGTQESNQSADNNQSGLSSEIEVNRSQTGAIESPADGYISPDRESAMEVTEHGRHGSDSQHSSKAENQSDIIPQAPEKLNSNFTIDEISSERLEYKFTSVVNTAKDYLWKFEDGTTYVGQSIEKQFAEEGEYDVELIVTAGDGTKMTTQKVIEAFKQAKFFIPNVFTPNNDGQNDVFDPQEKSSNLQVTKIIILDDKGKVFESQGEGSWDGNDLLGNPCPAGNYYYMVRALDRNHQIMEKTGSIRLIR